MKNFNYFGGDPCSTSTAPLGVTIPWLKTTALEDRMLTQSDVWEKTNVLRSEEEDEEGSRGRGALVFSL